MKSGKITEKFWGWYDKEQERVDWFAETKLCSSLTGPSENYVIDETLIRMIMDSRKNKRSIRSRSDEM